MMKTRIDGRPVHLWKVDTRLGVNVLAGTHGDVMAPVWTAPPSAEGVAHLLRKLGAGRGHGLRGHGLRGHGLRGHGLQLAGGQA